MSRSWVAAEASLPLDWVLVGVWLDAETPDTSNAVATGPPQPADMVTGRGGSAVQALRQLADLVRERRGNPGKARG